MLIVSVTASFKSSIINRHTLLAYAHFAVRVSEAVQKRASPLQKSDLF